MHRTQIPKQAKIGSIFVSVICWALWVYFYQSEVSVGVYVESVIIITSCRINGKDQYRKKKTTKESCLPHLVQLNADNDGDVLFSGSDACTSTDGILKEVDVYGVDMTVLEMQIEDGFKWK